MDRTIERQTEKIDRWNDRMTKRTERQKEWWTDKKIDRYKQKEKR